MFISGGELIGFGCKLITSIAGASASTLNPNDKSPYVNLSGGNLIMTGTPAGFEGVRGTVGASTGRYYFEVVFGGPFSCVGVATSQASLSYPGSDQYGWGYHSVGQIYYNGSTLLTISSLEVNDIVQIAVDLTRGLLFVGKNGVWQYNGNPVASGLSGTFFPMLGVYNVQTQTARFSKASWSYLEPEGYTNFA